MNDEDIQAKPETKQSYHLLTSLYSASRSQPFHQHWRTNFTQERCKFSHYIWLLVVLCVLTSQIDEYLNHNCQGMYYCLSCKMIIWQTLCLVPLSTCHNMVQRVVAKFTECGYLSIGMAQAYDANHKYRHGDAAVHTSDFYQPQDPTQCLRVLWQWLSLRLLVLLLLQSQFCSKMPWMI